jgi:hypothetical protein
MPVNLDALLRILSSIFNVVLIHISMHNICIHVNTNIFTFFGNLAFIKI